MAEHHQRQQHQGYQTQHQSDQQQQHQGFQYDVDDQQQQQGFLPQNGPSASHIVAMLTLAPIGGTLLFLAGVTLAGTIIGLAVSTPLFVIFSTFWSRPLRSGRVCGRDLNLVGFWDHGPLVFLSVGTFSESPAGADGTERSEDYGIFGPTGTIDGGLFGP